jgi:predicted small metal-binding protein
VDCDFEATGANLDEIMQQCAEHGIAEHSMKGFGPELYIKMRQCVRVIEDGTADLPV